MMKNLKTISMNGKQFKIEYFLGGDFNFLYKSLGFSAANSKYPCLYCTSAQKDFYKNKEWSISRTIEEHNSKLATAKKTDQY